MRGLALFAGNLQGAAQTRRKRETAGQPGVKAAHPRGWHPGGVRSDQVKYSLAPRPGVPSRSRQSNLEEGRGCMPSIARNRKMMD